jgi:hypothetical protein
MLMPSSNAANIIQPIIAFRTICLPLRRRHRRTS